MFIEGVGVGCVSRGRKLVTGVKGEFALHGGWEDNLVKSHLSTLRLRTKRTNSQRRP